MIRQNKRIIWITSLLILLPILFGVAFWNELPRQMPTHWGLDGTVNGWSSRPFAVFGLPLVIFAIHWLCVFFTAKDPGNQGQNEKVLGLVLWITPLVSLVTNGMVYAAALGAQITPTWFVLPLFGVMFVVIGNYLPKCRQNRTIGIKIKWTLENEENWNATHRFAGKLWTVGGILLVFCGFLPTPWNLVLFLSLTFPMVIAPVVYSYLYYKKHSVDNEEDK